MGSTRSQQAEDDCCKMLLTRWFPARKLNFGNHCIAAKTRCCGENHIYSFAQKGESARDPAIAHHLDFQSNQSLCGPAIVANILRSLGEQADTEAKVLAHTRKCRSGFCFLGLSLDELADVTRTATKRSVTVLRDVTPDAFRKELRHANDPSRRYVVNFSRALIFGTGVGHHSPIGGYLEDEDLVLVLDVNEKFKPWLLERPPPIQRDQYR